MATKPTAKKGAAKKPAAAAKKPAPAVKAKTPPPAKSQPKASPKPAPKSAPKPQPKAAAKPVAKSAPGPASEPPKKPVAPPVLSAPYVSPPPGPLAPKAAPGPLPKPPIPTTALTLSVQTSAGAAAGGNNQPATILVIVTCAGNPITELSKDNFTLMEHSELPGHVPFSNNITSFRNAGTGAYVLQTKPITGAPWRSGHHLAQLLVSSPDDQQGQAAIKLMIR